MNDDTGCPVALTSGVSRVVSLVPSLTEAVAASYPGLLVGATDWCTHPADLHVQRIGGTKNPDVAKIAALRPDLVIANREENRPADLQALREMGLSVWTTDIRTVDDGLASMRRLFDQIGSADSSWLDEATAAWTSPTNLGPVSAVIAIWRRPWMLVGSNTYAGDVVHRLGITNALGGHSERYPKINPSDLPAHQLVILPNEPYAFTADDGPEAFTQPCALVDGRALTWYGPAMIAAPEHLASSIRSALAR